jgi:hypothetical protein
VVLPASDAGAILCPAPGCLFLCHWKSPQCLLARETRLDSSGSQEMVNVTLPRLKRVLNPLCSVRRLRIWITMMRYLWTLKREGRETARRS